jgi:hypothetical protein
MIEFSADLDYLLEAGECDRVVVLDESGQHDALWFYPEQRVRDLERLARDLYALLAAPEPYTPAEMASLMAGMAYAKLRMSELGLDVD